MPRMWQWITTRRDLLAKIGLVLLILVVYGPQVRHSFIELDDDNLITDNPAVHELTPRSVRAIFTSYDPELYVPLTLFTYQIEYAIAGPNATVFHLTNLLLHIASTLLLLSLVRKLTGSDVAAFVVAALFAVHPLNVESVLWASARKDVLSSFFFLLSWRQYVVYRETDKPSAYWQSVAAFLCALLSKVSVVFLPLVLMLSDWVQGRPFHWTLVREKISHAVLSVVFFIVAIVGKAAVLGEVGTGEKVLLFLKSSAFYLQKIFVPTELSLLYPQSTPVSLSSAEFFVPLIIVTILLAFMLLSIKIYRWVTFGIAFFFLMLAPSAATFYRNGFLLFAADRYVYMAAIGIFLPIGMLIASVMRRGGTIKHITSGVVLLLVVVVACAGVLQTRVWSHSMMLFTNVLTHYPAAAAAHNAVGVLKQREGNWEEAQRHFEDAIAVMPTYALPYVNMAKHAEAEGDADAALEQYQHMLDTLSAKEVWGPDDANAVSIYAQLLEDRARLSEAIEMYRLIAQRADFFPQAHYNLGLKYQQMGWREDAIKEFERTIELQSTIVDAHYRLAALYAEAGRLEESIQRLRSVLRMDPTHAKARQHLESMERMR
jgi:protein O-mannosyl-transferase